jgi:hypothetical protein
MPGVRTHIMKAMFYNSQAGHRIVPRDIIEANCSIAGFDTPTIRDELDRLVEEGQLSVEGDGYVRVPDDE